MPLTACIPRVYRVYTACIPRVNRASVIISHEFMKESSSSRLVERFFFFAMCKDNFFPERMKLAGRNL